MERLTKAEARRLGDARSIAYRLDDGDTRAAGIAHGVYEGLTALLIAEKVWHDDDNASAELERKLGARHV